MLLGFVAYLEQQPLQASYALSPCCSKTKKPAPQL